LENSSTPPVLAWLPFAVPAVLLAWMGAVIAADGVALDAAVPVPSYMVAGLKVPLSAYRDSADALSAANSANGNAHIARGESMLLAGAPPADAARELANGLAHAPANVRGWTLLAEAKAASDPAAAARTLGVALTMAPRDFYLSGRRVRAAALLWPRLDPETRRAAQRAAVLLSAEPQLKPQYDAVMASPQGPLIQSMIVQNVLVPDLTVSVGR
jgi:hypothetical protein